MLMGLLIGHATHTHNQLGLDKYLPYFNEMVEITEFLFGKMYPTGKIPEPKVSFDSLVVIPMCLVAHKCRDHTTRTKAIRLLLMYPRKEGVWDSIFAGKMAFWAMELEEQFMDDCGNIPEWARINGMKFVNNVDDRTAALECRQCTSPFGEEIITRKTKISW